MEQPCDPQQLRHPCDKGRDHPADDAAHLRHAAITAALNAGANLRDVQDFARHADPKTTMCYDRNCRSLDRHATYAIAHYIAGSEANLRALRTGCHGCQP